MPISPKDFDIRKCLMERKKGSLELFPLESPDFPLVFILFIS